MSYPPLQRLIETFDACRCRIKTSSQTPEEGALPPTCSGPQLPPQPQRPDSKRLQQLLPARPSATMTERWTPFHLHYVQHVHPQLSTQLEGYTGDGKANMSLPRRPTEAASTISVQTWAAASVNSWSSVPPPFIHQLKDDNTFAKLQIL